jgi:acetyl esterase/lipase
MVPTIPHDRKSLTRTHFACVSLVLALFLLYSGVALAEPGRTITLWPQGAPGAVGDTDADHPTLSIYLPRENPTGTAIIICPGGGYGMLAMGHEGDAVAQWLNKAGVAAFVLKYRLGPRYHYPAPFQDGQRAVRYVRANATEFQVRSNHIGIMGFSAGGHLASTVATNFDNGQPDASDPVERMSSRPDFAVLAYPVISMREGITHLGSLHNLLGEHPDPALVMSLSNDQQVTPQTPPTFLFHTQDDPVVPVQNSINFYLAMMKAGVPGELHIFQHGQHGVGLAPDDPELSVWPNLVLGWLRLNGWAASEAHAAE